MAAREARRSGARRRWLALVGALLVAGCATSAPPPPPSGSSRADAKPARCSAGDPDRWAWFCVIGQILYGAMAAFQPASTPGPR